MTNVKCGFPIFAPSSQNLSTNLCKTQIAPAFVLNLTFFNFSDSFFTDQSNLENQNMFDLLAKDGGTRTPPTLIGNLKKVYQRIEIQ